MWFEQLTGFTEQGAAQVRQMMSLENGVLTSRANGASFKVGHFVTPSLAELMIDAKAILRSSASEAKSSTVQEVIADVPKVCIQIRKARGHYSR